MLSGMLMLKKLSERFTKKYWKKQFKSYKKRSRKEIKKKEDMLYVKWKGYDNSFNRWIDKKDIVI